MAIIVMQPADNSKEAVDWKTSIGQHITAVRRNILLLEWDGARP